MARGRVSLFLASGIVVALSACGGGGGGGGGTTTPPPSNPAPTAPTVSVSLSQASVTTVQAFSVTVAVAGSGAAPTGTVTLTSGSYSSGAYGLTNGSRTIPVTPGLLAVGADTLTASYTPDTAGSSTYTSASGTGTVTVSKGAPTVTVTLPSSPSLTTEGAFRLILTVSGGSSAAPTAAPAGWLLCLCAATTASGSWSHAVSIFSSF